MATKKTKTAAAPFACQTKDATAGAIKVLGDTQREIARLQADANDQIAQITQALQPQLDVLKLRESSLLDGIAIWCEANRAELLKAGGKTANLITGEVQWRQRPPSVSVRAADKVIATLRALGLSRLVRSKDEVDKEAILSEPQAVAGVAGITVVKGVEDLVVTPFEVELS